MPTQVDIPALNTTYPNLQTPETTSIFLNTNRRTSWSLDSYLSSFLSIHIRSPRPAYPFWLS